MDLQNGLCQKSTIQGLRQHTHDPCWILEPEEKATDTLKAVLIFPFRNNFVR